MRRNTPSAVPWRRWRRRGLLDREDARTPILTEKGYRTASYYAQRLEVMLNHLLYEGVDMESAKQDAFLWSLYCTDSTMEAIRATEERYRVKYELRDRKQFGGRTLCKKLKDGRYRFPFLIFREHIKNGSNLSMANEGFVHPCVLSVKDGVGTVQLRAVSVSAQSKISGKIMSGKVKNVRYFDAGRFISAESNGQFSRSRRVCCSLSTSAPASGRSCTGACACRWSAPWGRYTCQNRRRSSRC